MTANDFRSKATRFAVHGVVKILKLRWLSLYMNRVMMRQADCASAAVALPLAHLTQLWQTGNIPYIRQLGLNRFAGALDSDSECVKEVLRGCSSGSHMHKSPIIVVNIFSQEIKELT